MIALESQITKFKADLQGKVPPELIAVSGEWVAELSVSGLAESSLHAGQAAPDFALPDAHGQTIRLADLRERGPVVVIFYRGAWCPYCNITLRAYQAALPEIQALGASLAAISPMTPDYSLSLSEKAELGYDVLSDSGNTVARQFGLVYTLGDRMYQVSSPLARRSSGADLTDMNGDDSRELPLVATYVIDQSGTIRFAEVFADHAKRTEPSAVLDVLRGLS